MCRFIIIYLIFHFLTQSSSYKLFSTKGPKYPPTKGQVWPVPQYEDKDNDFYEFESSNFRVYVSSYSCTLLTDALKRYEMILRHLELFQRINYTTSDAQWDYENNANRILEELNVNLTSECEEAPHYNMNEKYHLRVGLKSYLRSESIWGILRGLETFVQLFYFPDDYSKILINATSITDAPKYKYRGLLIDTGRHYLSLSTIYKLIDALSMNKMNVLHWHIIDDQSFPYQSARFPTLSEKGAYFPSMVYTENDIRSVVAFARDRGIRVIPEIDVPGHTRSWGEAFPNILTECYIDNKVVGLGPLDPTKNETYELLQQLFQEVHRWFPDEYLHVGGDEVEIACWESNPHVNEFLKNNNMTVKQLQGYFMSKIMPLLPKQTKPIVWQDVFDMNALPKQKTQVQVWNFGWISEMDKILRAGHYVIFSSGWYIDYKKQPWERFYRIDPRQMMYRRRKSTKGLQDIVGGEACIWGEMADDTNILSKTWPRTSAIAERLWSGLDYMDNSDPVNDFVRRRIEEHTCRMNQRGIPAQPPNGPGFCVGVPPPTMRRLDYKVNNI